MGSLAERLVILRVPEEVVVTTMRDDVVNDGGFDYHVLLEALLAQWVLCQVHGPVLAPACIVAPLSGCATLIVVLLAGLLEMVPAVAAPVIGEVGAARIAAWAGRFTRHERCGRDILYH
jgi:hypothetical protein